jgi:hypothetical protein
MVFKKKGHNMLAIMLNPKYKSMCLVITYLGHEATTTLVVDYDKQLLLLLLLEVYKGLLPNGGDCLEESTSLVDSRDLFQQTNTITNTYKDIICQELGLFRRYLVDAEMYSCALTWWQTEKQNFPKLVALCKTNFRNFD